MVPWNDTVLEPGDIVLTAGQSRLGRLVRVFTRSRGERPTEVSHAAIVSIGGWIRDATIIEAKATVQEHSLWQAYGDRVDVVSVYRPRGLTEQQKRSVVSRASRYVGNTYGSLKLIPHLLDWVTGGHYWFRRLARVDEYPICSWIVAFAYDAIKQSFGVPPRSASPDDIEDYVLAHPEKFLCILPLGQLRSVDWPKAAGEA